MIRNIKVRNPNNNGFVVYSSVGGECYSHMVVLDQTPEKEGVWWQPVVVLFISGAVMFVVSHIYGDITNILG